MSIQPEPEAGTRAPRPDPRSIAVAARHGIDISAQRARRVVADDFARFDLVLGMDRSNVEDLEVMAGPAIAKAHGFIAYVSGVHRDVPDPYYGGPDGFEAVYRMIRVAAEALSERIGLTSSAPSSGHASSTI